MEKIQAVRDQYENEIMLDLTSKSQKREVQLNKDIQTLREEVSSSQQQLELAQNEKDQLTYKNQQMEEDLSSKLSDSEKALEVSSIEKQELEIQLQKSLQAVNEAQNKISKIQSD